MGIRHDGPADTLAVEPALAGSSVVIWLQDVFRVDARHRFSQAASVATRGSAALKGSEFLCTEGLGGGLRYGHADS